MQNRIVRQKVFMQRAVLITALACLCLGLLFTTSSAQYYRQFVYLYNDGTGIHQQVAEKLYDLRLADIETIVQVSGTIEGVSGVFRRKGGLWVAFLLDGHKIVICSTPHGPGDDLHTIADDGPPGWGEVTPPALASFGGKLIAAWGYNAGHRHLLKYSESSNGTDWSEPISNFLDVPVGPPDIAIHDGILYAAVPLGDQDTPGAVVVREIGGLSREGTLVLYRHPNIEFPIPGIGPGLQAWRGASLFSDGYNLRVGFVRKFGAWVTQTINLNPTSVRWSGKLDCVYDHHSFSVDFISFPPAMAIDWRTRHSYVIAGCQNDIMGWEWSGEFRGVNWGISHDGVRNINGIDLLYNSGLLPLTPSRGPRIGR